MYKDIYKELNGDRSKKPATTIFGIKDMIEIHPFMVLSEYGIIRCKFESHMSEYILFLVKFG